MEKPDPTTPQKTAIQTPASALNVTPPEPAAHVMKAAPETAPAPAVAPKTAPIATSKAPASMRVDSAGVAFDPEKHLDKPNRLTGRWMPRRAARLGNLKGEIGTAKPFLGADDENGAATGSTSEAVNGSLKSADEYMVAATSACAITYAVGMTIGGDEWKPTDDENANLASAWESYFRAKGWKDIPPGMALAIALLAYAGPRFRRPKTLSTLQKVGAGVRWVAAWCKRGRIAHAIPPVQTPSP